MRRGIVGAAQALWQRHAGDRAMSEMILSVQNLTKRFGGLVAVGDVSFDLAQGDRSSIIGPNGAGKTTLFNLLTGQLAPSSGPRASSRARTSARCRRTSGRRSASAAPSRSPRRSPR